MITRKGGESLTVGDDIAIAVVGVGLYWDRSSPHNESG